MEDFSFEKFPEVLSNQYRNFIADTSLIVEHQIYNSDVLLLSPILRHCCLGASISCG